MGVAQPWTSGASAALGGATITLVDEAAFCISATSGDIVAGQPQGMFFRDTRLLSEMRLRVNGERPEALAARLLDPFSAVFVVREIPRVGEADSPLMLSRHRYVGQGMREDIVVRNYGEEPARCVLEIEFDVDFADLFEVKEERVVKVGERLVLFEGSRLSFIYRRGAFHRASHLDFSVPPRFDDRTAVIEAVVAPRSEWSCCVQLTPEIDERIHPPRHVCGQPIERSTPNTRLEKWRASLPRIAMDHDGLRGLFFQSTEDLAALRLFDPDYPDCVVVAAGAPWFMTVFGRDSLLTSWMAMMADPDLALGALETLARFQGRDVDPVTEEEPGRILHEMRFGESAHLSLGGSHIYYGSVDATPLFVMLLGELRRWGNRRAEVDALLPAADRALEWIDRFGDRDQDGYVEYQRTTAQGLRNQGWKDSWDAVRFADGHIAAPPIAMCEVQGYVYAALLARAEIADDLEDHARAANLRERAADLKTRFNGDFWIEERGWLAMGLDRDKRPIDALTSNMGHCLWTGILDEERAEVVVNQLMSDQMFSGWGIRTLATGMQGYNPVSYQVGSVWPHDSAICAAGLARYGFVEEAHRVVRGIVDAAAHFDSRLPELFAGLGRDEYPFPVAYPTACSPQAWAAAAPLLLLRSMLRFDPDVPRGRLHIAPALPDWVGRLCVEGVPIADARLSFEAEGTELKLLEVPPGIDVVTEPR